MEGGVEYRHVGDALEAALARLDAAQVGGVVQWPENKALADAGLHLVVHENRLGELHAAMQHPMADGLDFTQVLDDSHLRVGHLGADRRQCLAVLGDVQGFLDLLAVGLVGQLRPLHADALHKPFAENRLVGHVKEGELEGRTA